jgi:uncharacterized protein involved in exopolysaccharide biosynthesis
MAQSDKAKLELRVADEPVVESSREAENIHFPEPLIILAKRKVFLLWFVGVAAVLAVTISLFMRNTYTANAKIMPPQQSQGMSMTAMLSQLGPLASLAGQGLGMRNPGDIYVSMLRSRTVADALIDRFSLVNVYAMQKLPRMDTRRKLEGRTEIVAGKEGIISISVEDRDPRLAADLANGYVDELEKLTKTLAVSEASKRRIFFEREVKLASEDLATAEVALKQTQEKTGLILLDGQSRAMIEALTSLRGRVAAQEVMVQWMNSFATPENPDLVRAKQELAALNAQLDRLEGGKGKRSFTDVPVEKVPSAGLEYLRKLREVKYRETLFELLAKQYEAAKIDEAKDALVVQPLDRALPPERKSWPPRALIVLFTTILATLGGVLAAFFMEALERAKDDSQFVARLHLFMFYLRRGHKA